MSDTSHPFEKFARTLFDEADRAELDEWLTATERLLAQREDGHETLADLAEARRWSDRLVGSLDGPERLADAGLCEMQGIGALRHLQRRLSAERDRSESEADRFLRRAFQRERHLRRLDSLDDRSLASGLVSETAAAVVTLDALRDSGSPVAERLTDLFPPLAALVEPTVPHANWEHEDPLDADRPTPLLDHLADRTLHRKLRGLEEGELDRFQLDDALSEAAFADECDRLASVRRAGWLPVVRGALLFLDFSKGGTPERREDWQRDHGVDLAVHNRASAGIVGGMNLLAAVPEWRDAPAVRRLVRTLIAHHGLVGQAVRGETPLSMFEGFVRTVRAEADRLADHFETTPERAATLAVECLHLIDICDTAAVREGLLDDGLRRRLIDVEDQLREVVTERRDGADLAERLRARSPWERARDDADDGREVVADRLLRLRMGRLERGEPERQLRSRIRELSEPAFEQLESMLRTCQIWYGESGSAALSPQGQLALLGLGLSTANRHPDIDPVQTFHLSFEKLVPLLGESDDPTSRYRVRLVDALLGRTDLDAILTGSVTFRDFENALGWFDLSLDGDVAIVPDLQLSAEAEALLTLLPIYEKKSSAAFHDTLKSLCDLYGLRKDQLDRVANERTYLADMNDSRDDKARMLDWARPGTIVEVGPGGGVIMDLCEERFADADVVGVDKSQMVVDALRERKEREDRSWQVVEGDAFELPDLLGEGSVDTVVFCSVLHEIYSYTRYPDEDGERFRLESVREMVRAAYRTLAPGGRMLIRDGIAPADGTRILEFVDPDGPEFLRLFAEQFEGRPIEVDWLDDETARMSTPDAMEFLYCYTWGPESFPYEVREQYGIATYDEYRDAFTEWLAEATPPPEWIDLPDGERSYLQDGYPRHLRPKVRLYDADRNPVAFPDSNCLMVLQKGS